MRIDNQNFSEANQSQWREPRFVFCVDFGDEDLYYLTSHEITGLSGENVIEGVLVSASGTSQKLNPDKANSEIGSISFKVLDDGLTSLQKEKLGAQKGLKGKRVAFYVGSADIDWADYIQATTQIVDDVTYKDRAYQFKCADIQRQMRKKIFEPKETRLTASLGLADGTIRALSTDEFQMVKQPVSPSGATAASGMTVGFIKVEGDQNDFEVIMYTSKTASEFVVASNESTLNLDVAENAATVQVVDASLFRDRGYGQIDGSAFSWSGKEGNTLTGCNSVKPASSGAVVQDNYGRGALGTKQVSVEIDSGTDRDNAPKITEFIYLEMPAPMLAYAVLTGAIYGYPGDYLPDHWNLGIPGEYIRTTEFTGIGSDLWDLSDFDSGLPARFENIEDKDGKQFVEEQLFRMMGCYSPIYSDGQIGLRRMAPVVSSGGFVRELNTANVAEYSDLQHDMKSVINKLIVVWNYSLERDALTRVNLLVDPDSIAQHGSSQPLELEFYGLSGSRVSYPTIKAILDSLRDRYAGPPLRLKLTLTPDQNDLEIGDIVRVSLDRIKDYTGEGEGQRLERNFEIQNIQTDWKTGKVTVSLFGSSQRASVLPPDIVGSPIPSEWYESEGTEISPSNFPGFVESAGGITRVVGDITLEGGNSLSDGIFWCGEDLTIEGGVDVAITSNVQLRVRGFLQVNGTINGRGAGLDGGEPVTFSPYPIRGQGRRVSDYLLWNWQADALGSPGFLRGDVMPQLGVMNDGAIMYHALVKHLGSDMRSGGIHASFPALNLSVTGGQVKGLPSDLRGSGGPGGGPAAGTISLGGAPGIKVGKLGGTGGMGGAGLAVICRGMDFGASAYIDLSGGNGERGTLYSPSTNPLSSRAYSGSGAGGGQGGLIIALDGPTATRPTIEGGTFKAEIGALDVLGQPLVNRLLDGDPTFGADVGGPHPNLTGMGGIPNGSAILPPAYIESGGGTPVVNRWASSFFMQALAGEIPVTPDIPEETENPASVIVAELTNTPRSANANLSTIEVAIEPPGVSSYKYAVVEYREKGDTGWFEVGPASPEVGFVVPSDGKTYEIRARGVSLAGNVVPDAPIQEITTTKILNADPGDEDVDDVVEVPNVHGLELFEQGNDAVFGGRDAKFVWRKTSVTEWLEMGSEGQLGASRGSLDLYFKDYQVEVWADGSLVRTEWVVDPAFVYTYEKNAEDYAREQGQAGAWRAFECRVYCRGRQNQLSAQAAKLPVENVAPELPDAVIVSAGFRSLQIDYDAPDDLDYKETRVWLSQTSGFTPGPANQVAQAYGGPVVISGLVDNTEYYLRFATYDAFGQGDMSAEYAVLTQQLTVGDLPDLETDIDQIEADVSLLTTQVAAQADELDQHSSDLAQHSTELADHASDLAQNAQDIAGNITAIGALDTRVTDAETGISSNSSAITGLDSRATDNEGDISANASAITQLQTDVTDAENGVTANSSAIDGLDTRVTANEGGITAVASDVTALQTGLSDAEGDIGANASAIDSLETRVIDAEGQVSANATAITQVEADLSNTQTDVSGNSSAIDALDTRVTTNEGEITAASSAITNLETGLTDAEGDISANSSAIDTLDTRVTSAEGIVSTHTSQITDLETDVSSAQGEISTNTSAIDGLDTRVTDNEGDISAQAGQVTQLESDVTDLQGETATNATAIDGLSTRVDDNEDGLAAQASDITALYSSVARADTLIFRQASEPTTADLENNDPQAPTLSLNFINQEFLVYGIPDGSVWFHTGEGNKPYVYEGGSWVDTQDQLTLTNATAIQTLDTRVTDTEDATTANATAITQLETDLADAEAGVTANSGAIDSLDTRVTSAEGEISANSTAITSLDTGLTDAETGISANASAVDSLDTRVTSAEGSISAQATDISTLSTTVDGHTASISQQASSIDGIEAKYVLQVDGNGKVTGIELASGAGGSSMIVQADTFAIIPSGGTPISVTPLAGLNVTPQKMGYFDGVNWTSYIDNNGGFYFGDGGDQFFKKDGAELAIGIDTVFNGLDSFNGKKLFIHTFFCQSYIPTGKRTATGSAVADWTSRAFKLEVISDSPGTAEMSHHLPEIAELGKDSTLIERFRAKAGIGQNAVSNGSYSPGDVFSSVATVEFFDGIVKIERETLWEYDSPDSPTGGKRSVTTTVKVIVIVDYTGTVVTRTVYSSSGVYRYVQTVASEPIPSRYLVDVDIAGDVLTVTDNDLFDETFTIDYTGRAADFLSPSAYSSQAGIEENPQLRVSLDCSGTNKHGNAAILVTDFAFVEV